MSKKEPFLDTLPEFVNRYEQGKVDVLVTGFLEHTVQIGLHVFPQGVPIRSNDHTATNWRVIGQLSPHNHVDVTLRKVFRLQSDSLRPRLSRSGE
ncbi:MAG: hypothetical protein CME25_12975 [Gemmatimonadetes bacterium]|nr:hypothetical protein [Gemmatimonadota bacterium]